MRRWSRAAAPTGLASTAAFLLALIVLRAAADAWRAPSLVPQRVGTRGLEAVLEPAVLSAFVTSLGIAAATTMIALLVGWPAARALRTAAIARWARGALIVLLAVPLLLPGYAVGLGLQQWLIRIGLDGTPGAIVAAHLVFVVPYVTVVCTVAFGDALRRSEELAAVHAISWWQRLRLVTLPVAAPTLATAAALGFLISWSDYAMSLAVGGGTVTLPLLLVPFAASDPQVTAALTLLFLVPPAVAFGGVAYISRRYG